MVRDIISIDEELCTGCGLCVSGCPEGAIQLIDGKARLVSETYCDGLGACIGECPEGAISIEKREAEEFDEPATRIHMGNAEHHIPAASTESISTSGCPGMAARTLNPSNGAGAAGSAPSSGTGSSLGHWPVQLSLLTPGAPYFENRELLLTADCVPVAVPDFHTRFLAGKSIAVACPKLDDVTPHLEKLTAILASSSVRAVKVLRMEVPCCSGLTALAEAALRASGKDLLLEEIIIEVGGKIEKPAINKKEKM